MDGYGRWIQEMFQEGTKMRIARRVDRISVMVANANNRGIYLLQRWILVGR